MAYACVWHRNGEWTIRLLSNLISQQKQQIKKWDDKQHLWFTQIFNRAKKTAKKLFTLAITCISHIRRKNRSNTAKLKNTTSSSWKRVNYWEMKTRNPHICGTRRNTTPFNLEINADLLASNRDGGNFCFMALFNSKGHKRQSNCVTHLFARPVFCNSIQYSITFWSRPETASNVIYSTFIVDKALEFDDPWLTPIPRSLAITSDRKYLVTSYPQTTRQQHANLSELQDV